jgi:hypothetical protein
MEDFKDAKVYGPGFTQEEPEESQSSVGITSSQALETITKNEIEIQISTAHKYPRSITRFKEEALSMATLDVETAESCFYVLKRKDKDGNSKNIEGPGVRLAEIALSAWGNARVGTRIIGEEAGYIIAQGVAYDLEKNVLYSTETRRNITKSNGKRYSGDMVTVNANAACAIVGRNAIFKIIPRSYINNIYEQAKRVAVGDQQTLEVRRQNAVTYFTQKLGIDQDRLFAAIDVESVEDITLAHVEMLIGMKTAIKDGDMSIDEAFPKEQTVKVSGDADALKKATPTQQTTGSGTIPSTPKQETKPEPETIETAKVPSAKRPYSLAFGNNNNVYLLRKEKEEFDKKYGAKAVQFVIDEFDGDIQANNGQQTYSNHQPEVARILGEKFGAGEQGKLI